MFFQPYSLVRIVRLNKRFTNDDLSTAKRAPMVEDVAAVVEVYKSPGLGYELECVDEAGDTQWLVTFAVEDGELENVC